MIRELTANGVECNDITKLKYPDGKTFYMCTKIIKDYPERMSKHRMKSHIWKDDRGTRYSITIAKGIIN